jgi:hypothetical protein
MDCYSGVLTFYKIKTNKLNEKQDIGKEIATNFNYEPCCNTNLKWFNYIFENTVTNNERFNSSSILFILVTSINKPHIFVPKNKFKVELEKDIIENKDDLKLPISNNSNNSFEEEKLNNSKIHETDIKSDPRIDSNKIDEFTKDLRNKFKYIGMKNLIIIIFLMLLDYYIYVHHFFFTLIIYNIMLFCYIHKIIKKYRILSEVENYGKLIKENQFVHLMRSTQGYLNNFDINLKPFYYLYQDENGKITTQECHYVDNSNKNKLLNKNNPETKLDDFSFRLLIYQIQLGFCRSLNTLKDNNNKIHDWVFRFLEYDTKNFDNFDSFIKTPYAFNPKIIQNSKLYRELDNFESINYKLIKSDNYLHYNRIYYLYRIIHHKLLTRIDEHYFNFFYDIIILFIYNFNKNFIE